VGGEAGGDGTAGRVGVDNRWAGSVAGASGGGGRDGGGEGRERCWSRAALAGVGGDAGEAGGRGEAGVGAAQVRAIGWAAGAVAPSPEPVGRRRGSRWACEDADGGSMEEHERKTMREVSDKVGPMRQG